jgi:hypothetical protein
MKSDNQIRTGISRFRMMLRTNLSMHIMPVLLAFVFVFITEHKLRNNQQQLSANAATPAAQFISPASFALLNAGNIQHVVTIYQVTRLAINVIR